MKTNYTIPSQTRIGHVHLKVYNIWQYHPDGTIVMYSHVLDLDKLLEELK